MANRVEKLVGEVKDEDGKKLPPPAVRAFKAVAWRCPDCQHVQFAAQSTVTRVEECRRCRKPFTIIAPA